MEILPWWHIWGLGLACVFGIASVLVQNEHLRCLFKPISLGLLCGAAYGAGSPAFLTMSLFLAVLGESARFWRGRAGRLYVICAHGLVPVILILLMRSSGADPPWDAFFNAPMLAVVALGGALSTELWLAPFAGGWTWVVRGYALLVSVMILTALTLSNVVLQAGGLLFGVSYLVLSLAKFRATQDAGRQQMFLQIAWGCYFGALSLIFWGSVRL